MDKLSVKYQYRSQNAAAVADAIMSTVGRRDGNYMVYFPSYEYMSEVQTLFKYKYPHIRTVVQAKGMSETARRGFLDTFRAGRADDAGWFFGARRDLFRGNRSCRRPADRYGDRRRRLAAAKQ